MENCVHCGQGIRANANMEKQYTSALRWKVGRRGMLRLSFGEVFFAFCQEFNFQIETRGTKEFRERCSISCGHNGATLSPEKVGMRVYYVAMIKMN